MDARETSETIDAKAAEWAVRIDDAPLSEDEQADLDAWLAGDKRRFGAFAKAQAVNAHLDRAKALGTQYDPTKFRKGSEPVRQQAMPSRRLFWLSGAVAAAAAAGIVLAPRLISGQQGQGYETRRGEVRLVSLPDGSSITLNTATKIALSFTAQTRTVRLLEGEALFTVVKEMARPFIVEAGDAIATALGGSFTVRRLERQPVQVLVRDGLIELKRQGLLPSKPVQLVANTLATAMSDSDAVQAVVIPAAQVTRQLSWREGMLSFDDTRLDSAVAEFSRYGGKRIVIDDPAVAAQTVTGAFAASDPEGFARTVATTLDLHTETSGDDVRLVR